MLWGKAIIEYPKLSGLAFKCCNWCVRLQYLAVCNCVLICTFLIKTKYVQPARLTGGERNE